jgi:hypothetical protein
MQLVSNSSFSSRSILALSFALILSASGLVRAGGGNAGAISGLDADGKAVTVNAPGRVTIVLYTNPDLEDDSRKLSLALDSYRSKPHFMFVRVVDLRGGVPPQMRGIVRGNIRKEQAKEDQRLKKAGIGASSSAPIIADYTGSTLNAIGWDSLYDQVHLVIYDPKGREVKRLTNVTSAQEMTKALDSVLM